MIDIDAGAARYINEARQDAAWTGPVRIALKSSGCCDPSLQLSFEEAGPDDLTGEALGVAFVMDRSTALMTGEVTIALVPIDGGEGLSITSARPLTEWDGFAPFTFKAP